MAVLVQVGTADFNVGQLYQQTLRRLQAEQGAACGAVASFVGLVRDFYECNSVNELFLEHYPGMTERSIAALIAKAEDRWSLLDTLVVHRVGALAPSDQIVFVQVAASHRPEAFAACEFIMDYLKTDAIFWKRESHASGTQRWVESTDNDKARAAAWAVKPKRD